MQNMCKAILSYQRKRICQPGSSQMVPVSTRPPAIDLERTAFSIQQSFVAEVLSSRRRLLEEGSQQTATPIALRDLWKYLTSPIQDMLLLAMMLEPEQLVLH